jgi:hypothetical protein
MLETWWHCRNPSLGLVTEVRACKSAGQKRSPRVTFHASGVQRVWWKEFSHSQVNSHVGSWNPGEFPNLQKAITGAKNSLSCGVPYIIENLLECRCLKWARMIHLHIWNLSYGQKKMPGIKLTFWLLTTKSQESTQLPCVQVACHILLERFRQGLKLCFRPHPNRRSAKKVMGPQSRGSPKLENFGTPTWES